jgi:hypothetical protein
MPVVKLVVRPSIWLVVSSTFDRGRPGEKDWADRGLDDFCKLVPPFATDYKKAQLRPGRGPNNRHGFLSHLVSRDV